MSREPTRADLKNLADIIAKFLISHGGMENGYFTHAHGDVRVDTVQSMKVRVDASEDVTIAQLRRLGDKLNEELRTYMEENGLDRTTIKVRSEHIEHGCFRTKVSYTMTEGVELWSRDVSARTAVRNSD